MMIQVNRVQMYVYVAIFHSIPAAESFQADLEEKGIAQGAMGITRDGTTVVWRMDSPEIGRSWGKDFEARWMQRLMDEADLRHKTHGAEQAPFEGAIENIDEILAEEKLS